MQGQLNILEKKNIFHVLDSSAGAMVKKYSPLQKALTPCWRHPQALKNDLNAGAETGLFLNPNASTFSYISCHGRDL